jgi:hypothetical protein
MNDEAPVAQRIEQLPSKQTVAGSSPAGRAKVSQIKRRARSIQRFGPYDLLADYGSGGDDHDRAGVF